MSLRDQWKKLKDDWARIPSFWKTLSCLSLALVVLVLLTILFRIRNEEAEKAHEEMANDWDKSEQLKVAVLLAPIKEEITYRGPAYLLILLFNLAGWLFAKAGLSHWNRDSVRRVLTIVRPGLIWIFVAVPTFWWALQHPYPLPIFALGLFFAWVMVRTKPAFLGLAAAILTHATWNGFTLLSIWIGGYRHIL